MGAQFLIVVIGALIAVGAFLFGRRALSGRSDRPSSSSVPKRITLKSAPPNWRDTQLMEALSSPFIKRGFKDLGRFVIPQLSKVSVQLLVHRGDSVIAAVVEHSAIGHWVDLASFYDDGTFAAATTSPFAQPCPPDSFRMIRSGVSPGALYTSFLRDRPQKPLLATTEATAATQFEDAYMGETQWRTQLNYSPLTIAQTSRASGRTQGVAQSPQPVSAPTVSTPPPSKNEAPTPPLDPADLPQEVDSAEVPATVVPESAAEAAPGPPPEPPPARIPTPIAQPAARAESEEIARQDRATADRRAAEARQQRERRLRQEAAQQQRRTTTLETPKRSPLNILGLTDEAKPEEIKRAYRALLRQYHPDLVGHLGPEIQTVAEEKTRVINGAYAELERIGRV